MDNRSLKFVWMLWQDKHVLLGMVYLGFDSQRLGQCS
jgi:hypothetical protein